MQFKKKPEIVEAFRFTGWTSSSSRYPEWFMGGNPRGPGGNIVWDCAAIIETPKGNVRAEWGDWIILGPEGDIYPCNRDIFEANYTRIDKSRTKRKKKNKS